MKEVPGRPHPFNCGGIFPFTFIYPGFEDVAQMLFSRNMGIQKQALEKRFAQDMVICYSA